MDDSKKFIITTDVNTALMLHKLGFTTAGQDGKTWYFLNDSKRIEINKHTFANNNAKYSFTNRMLFNSYYGVQYKK